MSKDPAYLFYDGDAAKDVSHMNRLERGAYFDILQTQRKFGRMSLEIIKKVLGQDFDKTWEAIKIILTYVEDKQHYFVLWLEESCIKRQKYCESRSVNRTKSKINTKKHMSNISLTYVEHMENENENEIDIKNAFELFRKLYPGSKRGLDTEYNNLCKKHDDYKNIIPLLSASLENQINWRTEMIAAKMFVPEWKMLQTWINQRCWEMEKPTIQNNKSEPTIDDFYQKR
jgi:hypothetical protein